MGLGDEFDDRQTKPGAAACPRARFVHPVEAIPDMRYVLRRNAGTGIRDDELRRSSTGCRRTSTLVPGWVWRVRSPAGCAQLRQPLLIADDHDRRGNLIAWIACVGAWRTALLPPPRPVYPGGPARAQSRARGRPGPAAADR